MPSTPTSRRRWLVAIHGSAGMLLCLAGAGCSAAKAKKRSSKDGKRTKNPNKGPNKGPKTMGNLLVDGYIADLKEGSAEKRVAAAVELGNMGATAKQALPALEALATDGNAKVREAVSRAIKSIRK